MPVVPFVGQQRGRTPNAGAVRYLNVYPHMTLDQSVVIYGTPGLERVASLGHSPIRGMHVMGDYLYAVAFDQLYKIDQAFAVTALGTLSTRVGPVSMADNGQQLIIVDGVDGYLYVPNTATFSQIADVDFPVADTVCFLDGYFIVNAHGTNTYFYSSLYDGAAWDALDFNAAEASPDRIIAVAATFGFLYVFGSDTTEIWYNAGDPDSVFRRADGMVSNLGCAAPFSVAKVGETGNQILWLASTPQGGRFAVSNAGGSAVDRISTAAVEYHWSQYGRADDALGYGYTQEGHVFYVLTFPTAGATWVYDISTSTWHERESNGGAHLSASYAFFAEKHLVGSRFDGALYRMDMDVYTDDGSYIAREVVGPTFGTDERMVSYLSVQVDMERGGARIPVYETVTTPDDPYFADVSAIIQCNGTEGSQVFEDEMGHVVSVTGLTHVDTSNAMAGSGSARMVIRDDYLETAVLPSFGQDKLTAECWIKVESFAETKGLFSLYQDANNHFSIAIDSASSFVVDFKVSGVSMVSGSVSGMPTLTANTWHHIAISRYGTSLLVYFNGVSWAAGSLTVTGPLPALVHARWGYARIGAVDTWWTGGIDDMRVSGGIAVYTSPFSPPTAQLTTTLPSVPFDPLFAGVCLSLHCDGTDGSTNVVDVREHTIFVSNCALDTFRSKFGGASLYFPAYSTNNFIYANQSADTELSGDFTVAFWIYWEVGFALSAQVNIFRKSEGTFKGIAIQTTSGKFVHFLAGDGGAAWAVDIGHPSSLVENNWYYLAFTRSGNTYRGFVNGLISGSATWAGTPLQSGNTYIGGYPTNTNWFAGWIDDVLIDNVNARWTASFTVPSSANPDIGPYSVVSLCHADGANGSQTFADAVTTMTAHGGAHIDTASPRFGSGAASFDTVPDSLTVSDASAFVLDGQFTVECFVSPDGDPVDDGTLFALVGTTWRVFRRQSFGYVVSLDDGTTITNGITIMLPNTWYHVALTRDALDVVRLFVGGVKQFEYVNGATIAATGIMFGRNLGLRDYFGGNFDEIRATRQCRYTADFDVPTPPWPTLDSSTTTTVVDYYRDPELMLSWSNDAGHTWTEPMVGAIGTEGDTTFRVLFRRLGRAFRRTFKLRITDPVKIAILNATVKTG